MSEQVEPLIRGYELELVTPGCFPGAPMWRAELHLENEIREVLPYLNAVLDGAEYHPEGGILIWRGGEKGYAFRPKEIAVALVADRAEAEALAEQVVDMVNDVWSRRHEIEPSYEGKRRMPDVMAIYKLLPRTNCKECGYPTCMAFANALRADPSLLANCPYLPADEYAKL
jgi:ArsR family metal-binding transcriptional regulator